MNISIDFLGLKLKNPLMLTEGPLSGNRDLIEKAAEAGAGLIFTKGIRPEEVHSPVPYMGKYRNSLINADWSCIGLNNWIKVLADLDREIPLVTSIAKNYVTPQRAVDMAKSLVKAGSRIISFVDYNAAELVETVKMARRGLKVPIMVKLPPFLRDLEEVLKNLKSAGVDAIAAMDSIGPVMAVDTDTGEPSMGSSDGSGYLSGQAILPVTLRYIYEISRFVDLPVVGVGGVTDSASALQMIMAGATGVGMVTAPMLEGLGVFKKVESGIKQYMLEKGYGDISEIRGLSRRRVEERRISEDYRSRIDSELCTACGRCFKVCYSEAIIKGSEYYRVITEKCVGCGLCASVCQVKAVSFI